MPSWPAALPQYVLVQGFGETPPDLIAETAMSSGPRATRRRFTAGETEINAQIAVTIAQKATLQTFFDGDLKGGAIAFDWVHPVTRAATSFRMRRPRYSAEAGGATFIATLELLEQP